jgi:nitrite reductase/ring-hydroxylating ferredoxin subunit
MQKQVINIFSIIFLGLFLLSCDDPKPNDLLPDREVNVVVDLGLPIYQNLLVPGGFAYTPTTVEYGFKGIIVINKNSNYIAYERACPHLSIDECTAMTYDGLYLKCTCDNTLFNPLTGGTSSTSEFQAREYHVQNLGGNQLRITNF